MMTPFEKFCPRCVKQGEKSASAAQHAAPPDASELAAALQSPVAVLAENPVAPPAGYKQCPECGQVTAVALPQCPQCGHKYRTQFANTPKPAQHTVTIGCVLCGNADIRKVSVMAHAAEDAPAAGALAGMLTAPVRPQYTTPAEVYRAGGLAVLFLLCLIATFAGGGAAWLWGITALLGIASVTGAALAGQAVSRAKARLAEREARWEQMMDQWNMLFYCPRCDCVYNPATRRSAPPHAMRTVLLNAA